MLYDVAVLCSLESGRVFMFGPNDYGQLGVGPQKIANRPSCIKCKYP